MFRTDRSKASKETTTNHNPKGRVAQECLVMTGNYYTEKLESAEANSARSDSVCNAESWIRISS